MRILLCILFLCFASCYSQTLSIRRTVYFDFAKATLSKEDSKWVDSVSKILVGAASYNLSFKGYCDEIGSAESNIELSRLRINVVKDAFMMRGAGKNINEKYFGETEPAAENSTETGRAKNRRAVIDITYELKNPPSIAPVAAQKAVEPIVILGSSGLGDVTLEVGKTLILKNLNFEGGSPILLPESEPTLKELLKLMQDNRTLEIEIGGHVCCGPDMELSVARAKRVFNYLLNHGIKEDRMTYKGYSFNKPVTKERTDEERTINRRVEITVLKL